MSQVRSATVLLTGATGFLGGAVAAELLRWPSPVRVLCLIRASGPDAAERRLRRSLERFVEAERTAYCWDRAEVLPGDLTEPATLRDPRLDEVSHVIHLAADTSFRSRCESNVVGTVALAKRMGHVRGLERFLHVGTAFICGANPPRTVHENGYPRADVQHLVNYTRSKAEAELALADVMHGQPLIVARPSIVVGHTRLGCRPSASIFWYYHTLAALRRVPVPLDVRKDIVPVDYVAATLLQLLFQRELRHERYHVSAGDGASVSWQQIFKVFSEYHGSRSPVRVVSHAELSREGSRIRELLGVQDETRMLSALEPFFRFSSCGVEIFDNHRILVEGIPAPPRFTDYLRVCIESTTRTVDEQRHDDE